MRLRLTAAFFLASAIMAGAQDKAVVPDFGFVKGTTPSLILSNPAGLAGWNGKIAMAGLEFDKGNGRMIPLTGSPDSYKLGAVTESFYRVSDRLAFHGLLSWSGFKGMDMGAQILMDPDYNPVNFLESDPGTVGVKNREMYSMLGGLSYSLSDRWAAGINVDYVAGDQTKVKDPRFSDVWMDLGLEAGVGFRPSGNLLLGASAIFRYTLEQVRGGIYGTTDKQYFIYTDKGGFFGTVSSLDGDYNHISDSGNRPMHNLFFGGSVQAVMADRFTNELTFLVRDGYFGKRSSSTVTFFEFSGISLQYEGTALFPKGDNLHKLALSAAYNPVSNEENLYAYVTPEGQGTRVDYTGQNHLLDRNDLDVALSYHWFKGVTGGRPELTLGIILDGFSRSQTTTVYPYYRKHGYTRLDADLFGIKDFRKDKSIFTVEVHGLMRTGFGTEKEDGTYASSASTNLRSFDVYLGRQFEYETAARAGAALAFKYTMLLSRGFAPYIRLADSFTGLISEPQSLEGRTRNVAAIIIGCDF